MDYYFGLHPKIYSGTDQAYDFIEVLNKKMCEVINDEIPIDNPSSKH